MAKEFTVLDKDDDQGKKAHEDAVKDLKIKEAEGAVTVDMSEDEDDDDTPSQPQRSIRQQKKDDRWKRHTQETREAKERAEKAENEARLLREQMQRNEVLSTRMLERIEQQAPKPTDKLEEEENNLLKARQELQEEYAKTYRANNGVLPQETIDHFQKRNNDIELNLIRSVSKRAARDAVPRKTPQQLEAEQAEIIIRAKHPDVTSHPQANQFAIHMYEAFVAAGEPRGHDTLDKAMDTARERFHMNRKPAVSDSVRRKFASPPRGGSGGGEPVESEVLSKDEMALARAFSPKMDEQAAARRFVRMVKRG